MKSAKTNLLPQRALLHPAWLVALLLLAVNDHLLKGSGLLPSLLTGKLSDIAGLIVAPALLATAVCVRSNRAWVACHVAVGTVFAAIQLSTFAAAGWSAVMGLVGFPWWITSDVTDLLALPALGLSYGVLRPAMQRAAISNLRRSGQTAAAGAGLVCCIATSPPPEDFTPSIFADVHIHNDTGGEIVVRVRMLEPSVDFDCDAVAQDPGRLLTEPLFQPAQSWTLRPHSNASLLDTWDAPTGPCLAALVDGDGFAPTVVFWESGSVPSEEIPGEGDGVWGQGAVVFSEEDDEGRIHSPEMELAFPQIIDEAPADGVCAPQEDADRLAWSSVPTGPNTLEAIDLGADGCHELTLMGASSTRDWYLCVPAAAFPFEVGDSLEISELSSVDSDGVRVTRTDETGERPTTELTVARGSRVPAIAGIATVLVPEFDCALAPDQSCGTVARAAELQVSSSVHGDAHLLAGESAKLEGSDGSKLDLFVMHAQDRPVVDPACAEGPFTIGPDVEIAAVHSGAPDTP